MSGLGIANQETEKVIKNLRKSFPKIIDEKQEGENHLFSDDFNKAPAKPVTAPVASLDKEYSSNAVKAVWNVIVEVDAIIKLAMTKGVGREVFSFALSKQRRLIANLEYLSNCSVVRVVDSDTEALAKIMMDYFLVLSNYTDLLLDAMPWYIRRPVNAMLQGQEKKWLADRVSLLEQQIKLFSEPGGAQLAQVIPVVKHKPFNQAKILLHELTAYMCLLESNNEEFYLYGDSIPGELATIMEWKLDEIEQWKEEYKAGEKARSKRGWNMQYFLDSWNGKESPQARLYTEVKAKYDKAKAESDAIDEFNIKIDKALVDCREMLKKIEPSLMAEKKMKLLPKVSVKTKKQSKKKLETVQSIVEIIEKMLLTEELQYKFKQIRALIDIVGLSIEKIKQDHQGGKIAKAVGVGATKNLSLLFGTKPGVTYHSKRTEETLAVLEKVRELLQGQLPPGPEEPVRIHLLEQSRAPAGDATPLDEEETAFPSFGKVGPF